MTEILKKGSSGAAVLAAQQHLKDLGFDPGPLDGIYGPRTKAAVQEAQLWLRLDQDGDWGPLTEVAVAHAMSSSWYRGQPYLLADGLSVLGGSHLLKGAIPATWGKGSTFGGPKDLYDYYYGQALIGASSVARLYERYPTLIGPVFRAGLADPLPVSESGRRYGLSWCLDAERGWYCAMRWPRGGRPDPTHHRVVIQRGELAVVVVPTDWGPAERTGCVIDLSDCAMDALKSSTKRHRYRIGWAADDTTPGLYTVRDPR